MHPFLKIILLALLSTYGFSQETENKETQEDKDTSPVTVLMATSLGDIHILLDAEHAPKTVENFLTYVDAKHYDGTIFHRVIDGFMIQGGGFKINQGSLEKLKTRPTIQNESQNTPANKTGTIAMARLPNPHSAAAQFFINVANNDSLNYPHNGGGYATFGKVTKGMSIVRKIQKVKTTSKNGMRDVPEEAVTIKSISRVEEK